MESMNQLPPHLLSNVLEHLQLQDQSYKPKQRDVLLDELKHSEWSVRAAAIQELGNSQDPILTEALQAATSDTHVSVRAAAIYALGKMHPHSSRDTLIKALSDTEWQVREKAVLALAYQEPEKSFALLKTALSDPDNTVRESASYVLNKKGLVAPLKDSNSQFHIYKSDESNRHKYTLNENVNTYQKNILTQVGNTKSNRQHKKGGRGFLFMLLVALLLLVVGVSIVQQRQLAVQTQTGSSQSTPVATIPPTPTVPLQTTKITTLYTYQSSYRSVYAVAWSFDNKRVVMADNAVTSWDATTGKNSIYYAEQIPGDVTSVSWSPNGQYIAGSGTKVELWHAQSGQSVGIYTPQLQGDEEQTSNDRIYDSVWSPDSRLIASAANGQAYGFTLQVWNPESMQLVFSIPSNPKSYIRHVKWSPNGKYIAFDADGKIHIYNVETRKLVSQNIGSIFAWSPDSTKIISTDDNNGTMLIWESNTGQSLAHMQYQDPNQGLIAATALSWSPDGKHIILAAGSLTIWDVNQQKKIGEYTGHVTNASTSITSLAWSPNGTMIASSSGGSIGPASINIWKLT